MAKAKKGDVRQLTLMFRADNPLDAAMLAWLEKTGKRYSVGLQVLAKAAIDAGMAEAEKRAEVRYKQLLGFDAGLMAGLQAQVIADQGEAAQKAADAAKAEPAQGRSGLPT